MPHIGTVLREARLAAGIGQQALAAVMHVSVWTLNRLEHGHREFERQWLAWLPNGIRQPVAAVLIREAEAQLRHLQLNTAERPCYFVRGN